MNLPAYFSGWTSLARGALLAFTVLTAVSKTHALAVLENSAYRVEEQTDGSINVIEKSTGKMRPFSPSFEVIHTETDPKKGSGKVTGALQGTSLTNEINYSVLAWNGEADFSLVSGLTRDVRIPSGSESTSDRITWEFDDSAAYTFSAHVDLLPGSGEPVVTFSLEAVQSKYFSVAYVGAPPAEFSALDWFYQPMLWSGKRFPAKVYITEEGRCPVPMALYSTDGVATGLYAKADAPALATYRLPTLSNSRFGVAGRNGAGKAQPTLFAPILGGDGSQISAGNTFTFSLGLVVKTADLYNSYTHIAGTEYGVGDYRTNTLTTLNQTLDNMVSFLRGTENYSAWSDVHKTNEYVNDIPGYGRQQSPASHLALALIRDDEAYFETRALPTIEYFMSRSNALIKLDGYDGRYGMGGPVAGAREEYVALSQMTNGRIHAINQMAKDMILKGAYDNGFLDLNAAYDPDALYTRTEILRKAKTFLSSYLSMYRLTGDEAYRVRMVSLTNKYIAARIDAQPVDFVDADSSFYQELTPLYDVLFEVAAETGDPAHLDAAVAAVREFAPNMQASPRIPSGDMTFKGETLPAWRFSEIGLISESAGTSHSHRGIFMPYMAPYFLRAAHYGEDSWLRTLGRNNLVGRYANYPGYTLRTEYSGEYEKAGYPLKPYRNPSTGNVQWSNTAHMNHPVPMACMIIDYLVTDVFDRSNERIRFPSRFSNTGGYFQYPIYGDRPGVFHGDENVRLWMPAGVLTSSSVQVNHLTAYGNGKLYVALCNQSSEPVTTTITLDPAIPGLQGDHDARVWEGETSKPNINVAGGSFEVTIPAKGITAVAIDGITIAPNLQNKLRPDSPLPLPPESVVSFSAAFGNVTGMVLSFSEEKQKALVYTDADSRYVSQMTLYYRIDGATTWEHTPAKSFPFEFAVLLPEGSQKFEFYMVDNKQRQSGTSWIWADPAVVPPARTLPSNNPVVAGAIVIDNDNSQVTTTGAWGTVTASTGNQGVNYLVLENANGPGTVTYSPALTAPGYYSVYYKLPAAAADRAPNAAFTVTHVDAVTTTRVDQRSVGGRWELLGTYLFLANGKAKIVLSSSTANTYTVADAICLVPRKEVGLTDPPAETVPLFSDDFEDGSKTRWTGASGANWKVIEDFGDKVLDQSSLSGTYMARVGAVTWTDYSIQANMKFLNMVDIVQSGLLGRYRDSDNYYFVRMFSDSSQVQLLRRENGKVTTLASAPAEMAIGAWYTLKLEMFGRLIRVWVNGEEKISYLDMNTSLSSGQAGVRVVNDPVQVDDVTVTGWRMMESYDSLVDPATLTATASDSWLGREPIYAVNGAGMAANEEHVSDVANQKMWMGADGSLTKWFVVDLGREVDLTLIRLWNFNWAAYTERGVNQIDVYTAPDGAGPGNPKDNPGAWTKYGDGFRVPIAPGTPQYGPGSLDRPLDIRMDPIRSARWVAFIVHNAKATGHVGFSEVRFYEFYQEPKTSAKQVPSDGLVATASDSYASRGPEYAINGAGLSGDSHTNGGANLSSWMSLNASFPKWFKIDLTTFRYLQKVKIWNFNWKGTTDYTPRGAKDIEIYYSKQVADPGNPKDNPGNWTLFSTTDLSQAPGTATYNTPDELLLKISARWFALKINNTHSTAGLVPVGLAEVQLFEVAPELVPPSSLEATANHTDAGHDAMDAVNGAGLTGGNHSSQAPAGLAWKSSDGSLPDWFKVDLGQRRYLHTADIWNLNSVGYLSMGAKDLEVFASTSATDPGDPVANPANWSSMGVATLNEAPGTDDYGTVEPIDQIVVGQPMRWVALKITSGQSGSGVGLSELQFNEIPPQAIDPLFIVATASDHATDYDPKYAVNGAGLTGSAHTRDVAIKTAWKSATSVTPSTPKWVRLDLSWSRMVKKLKIWNFNQVGLMDRGAAEVEVLTSNVEIPGDPLTNPANWTVVTTTTLPKAPGSFNYGTTIDPAEIPFDVETRWIALKIISGHFANSYVGISEIQVFEE